MKKEKVCHWIALISLIICILVWVPNLLLRIPSPLWLLTFIVAPIGGVCAILVRKYWLAVANALMFFSFFIVMYMIDFINNFTGGKM